MFIKSWAYLFKHGDEAATLSLPPEITPDFDRSAIKDPKRLELIYLNEWITLTSSGSGNERNLRPCHKLKRHPNDEIVRATFGFTQEDIKKLREHVLLYKVDGDLTKPELHLSTFVLTYAYTITCIVKAKGGACPSVAVSFNVECMSHLDPSLPPTYFGSSIWFKGQRKGVLAGADEKIKARFAASKEPRLHAISVAGSPQLKFYESDFGLGRLKKVQIVEVSGIISMIDSPDGRGGVEVGLLLKKQEMENFATFLFQGLRNII
ncbi:Transferase [Corchorus olitorius]|uniref:Transferase n=1 Tax=Corchorus olitorius TaxID=93759 RepID=A0A1R3I4Q8_9ROSI|nr:Transferase [Corchorus olitorius]